jgi:hypothetical protein
MIIRFAYLKQVSKNRVFTPGSAISTYVQSAGVEIKPLGGTGVDAPSTLLINGDTTFYMAKPWSACHAALTAATSADTPISLF